MTLNVLILSLESLSKLQLQNSHIFILLKLRFMVFSNQLLHWVTIKCNQESADFNLIYPNRGNSFSKTRRAIGVVIKLALNKKMLTFAQNHVKKLNLKVMHVLDSIFGKKNQKVKKEYVFFKLIWLQEMVRKVLLVTSHLGKQMTNLIMSNQREDADFQMVPNKRVVSLLTARENELITQNSGNPNFQLKNANKSAQISKIALVSIHMITKIAISKRRMYMAGVIMRVST